MGKVPYGFRVGRVEFYIIQGEVNVGYSGKAGCGCYFFSIWRFGLSILAKDCYEPDQM